jgi:hypothetical protein
MLRPCPVCEGNTTEVGAPPCQTCADTGYFFEVSDRLAAADRLLRALQEEAKLLGEHPAEQRNVSLTVGRSLLERMAVLPEDELDEIIAMYSEPVSVVEPLALESARPES